MDGIHPETSASQLHLVLGSGGTKAILAGTGAILAFRVAGMTDWRSIGGASGGSIPAALMASGQDPALFLRHVIDTNFSHLIVPRRNWFGRMLAIIRKYHYERTRPSQGAYGTDQFKRFVNETIPSWPDKFWTVASCGHGQVLLTKEGVFKFEQSQEGTLEARGRRTAVAPPQLGTAIAATCAMPGIIDAVHYNGEYLFDGALSGDGECPINVVPRHFAEGTDKVVAVDVGEEEMKNAWWLRALWHLGCGGKCETSIEAEHVKPGDALLVVNPKITGFHALDFALSRDAKWRAVIAGFVATTEALVASGLAAKGTTDRLIALSAQLQAIEQKYRLGAELTCHVESFLAEHGLFMRPTC